MSDNEDRYTRLQQVGLVLGPLLFVSTRLFVTPAELSPQANAVLASTLWIAVWWMTEAIPLPATSLLPILLFPTLGVTSVTEAAAPYADPVVFLFLGGFLIALAIERWNLHRRIALTVLLQVGDDARYLILGFMIVTGFLSMWVSNTATAMMMVPMGMAIVAQVQAFQTQADAPPAYTSPQLESLDAGATSPSNFGAALMLGIAYAASIGGSRRLSERHRTRSSSGSHSRRSASGSDSSSGCCSASRSLSSSWR